MIRILRRRSRTVKCGNRATATNPDQSWTYDVIVERAAAVRALYVRFGLAAP